MTTEKQKPAHEIRLGSVKAAIWANRSDKSGPWHTASFSKLYKSGENWKRTGAFGANDLPLLIRVAEDAADWMKRNASQGVRADSLATSSPDEATA